MHCVVHYKCLNTLFEIKPLTEPVDKRLKKNKLARHWLGGKNEHARQYQNIPHVRGSTVYGFHQVCFQKFSKSASIEKKKRKEQ